MKLYYFSSLLVLWVSTSTTAYGQNNASNPFKFPSEAGILLGASNYAGDIVKKGDYDLSAACFNFGAFYRLYSNNNLSWRFGLNQGKLKGDDNDWTGTDRVGRGFSFSTSLTEISARAEYDFMNHKRWNTAQGFSKKFSLYVFGGAGFSLINANPVFNDELGARYDQLISEDEQNQRSLMLTLPFGGGVKVDLSERLMLGAELSLNPVFNDYLDGISVSANPKFNDWYSVGGVTLSYRLQSVIDQRFFIKKTEVTSKNKEKEASAEK